MRKPAVVCRWLIVLALAAGAASRVEASTVSGPGCISMDSFTAYSQLVNGCSSGILQFFNFALYDVNAGGAASLAPTSFTDTITVDPLWNASTGVLTLTIGGFTTYTTAANTTRAWRIDWSTDPAPVVAGERMQLDPPFGRINGSQTYCPDSTILATGLCSSGLSPGIATFNITTPAYIAFTPSLYLLDTQTTVRLNPDWNNPSGIASGMDAVVFELYTAPEPGSVLLMAAGIGVILLSRTLRRG